MVGHLSHWTMRWILEKIISTHAVKHVFITKHLRFRISKIAIELGDKVKSFAGGKILLILRPHLAVYWLIGHAYIDGLWNFPPPR